MLLRHKINSVIRKHEKPFITHNLIQVSKSALVHNLGVFRSISKDHVIPVLKANAYGHGIEQVAMALESSKIPYVAVDGYFEALRIRSVSDLPVLVMGAIMPENFENLKYDNFAFVVQDAAAIRALGHTGKHVKVHLECNTGMNRYGAKIDEIADLVKLILRYKNLKLEGVMSHLATSDSNDSSDVNDAVKLFDACVELVCANGAMPTLFHVAQSAGSLRAKSKYANAMRLGIGLYGISPFSSDNKYYHELREQLHPALKLTSTITKIIQLDEGDKVSYDYTYVASKPITMAVLPIGYHEGLDRALSNVGKVKIGEEFVPIIGRVCMNHCMINLDGVAARVGDQVVVYSNDPNDENCIDNIAKKYGIFNYGMLTALSPDTRRELVK